MPMSVSGQASWGEATGCVAVSTRTKIQTVVEWGLGRGLEGVGWVAKAQQMEDIHTQSFLQPRGDFSSLL